MTRARTLADLGSQSLATTADIAAKIDGDGITDVVALTQAEYDALTPDASTLYVVTD